MIRGHAGNLSARLLRCTLCSDATQVASTSQQALSSVPRQFSTHGAGASVGEAGSKNSWEAPTNPGSWKANQRGWVAMGAFGVGGYALLSGWLRSKEADKPYMEKEAKGPPPLAKAPSDRQGVSVGDAVAAAIPGKVAARGHSNAPTASPSLEEDRQHGQVFEREHRALK